MFRQWTYRNWAENYLAFLVVISVVLPRVFGILVLPYLVLLMIGYRRKEMIFRLHLLGILFIALYLAYAIGLIFADNLGEASTYLEYKLSFLMVPLLLGFRFVGKPFQMQKLATGLIVGVGLAALYGVFHSLSCYAENGSFACWLTVNISPLHHPSYFMCYMITALYLSWHGWRKNWKFYSLKWVIPFTFFGFVYHILSLSLAGILVMLLVGMAVIVYLIYKRFGKWSALLAFLLMPLLGFLFVTKVPQVEGEWTGAKWYAEQYMNNPEEFIRKTPYPSSGSEQRLILWTVAWQELKEHPWGVGTGNLDAVISRRLIELGQVELAKKNMNPHNQFLQTGIEIGVLGLLLLLSILFYSLYLAIRHKSGLLLLLTTSLAFNSLFESMLQRQSGIVFFTFWMCLVVASFHQSVRIESNES